MTVRIRCGLGYVSPGKGAGNRCHTCGKYVPSGVNFCGGCVRAGKADAMSVTRRERELARGYRAVEQALRDKRYDEAIAALEAMFPEDKPPQGYYLLGLACEGKGDIAAAKASYRRIGRFSHTESRERLQALEAAYPEK